MKLAIVASGWHYPKDFYEQMTYQLVPKGWTYNFFCISHRDPKFSIEEKKDLELFEEDLILYDDIISVEQIEKLGWNYKEYPNTIGDWGCSNQWLQDYDYKDYNLILFTHDDNLILQRKWLANIIANMGDRWEILCNSCGDPKGWIRGSCEFFKPSLLDKIGGKFDLSGVTLDRVGQTDSPNNFYSLDNWNQTVFPLMKFIHENNIQVAYMSNIYRHSDFVIEGERGFIKYKINK